MGGGAGCLRAVRGLTPSPEQQAILDLGPATIRVRAGAGTGKTTTLAMVIANLVDAHGIEPEQVLGITFTNKAAAELANRSREVLTSATDSSRQVEVHTYHGFAAQVLAEFGPLAGVDNRADVITPTFARQMIAETLHHRSFDHLDITQARTIDRIRRLNDGLGDHLLGPEEVAAAAPQATDETWAERIEMLGVLEQYAAEKRRLRVVDYADLVTLASRVVTEFPQAGQAIRERYQAVLLDEYQDTNPAQRVLLQRIFGDATPVIAVGDEDQTIYEWRGASSENFVVFSQHFGGPSQGLVHDRGLTLNRRSSPEILEVANQARSLAGDGADTLEPVDPQAHGEVITYWAGDAIEEAEWIATSFERLHQEGAAWSDMAVLIRKNKDFSPVIEALTRHEIPLEVANVGGLLSVPEVAEIRAWLTILDRPEDSAALIQVLLGSRYRLGLADLAALTRWVAAEQTGDEEEPAPLTLIEAIESAEQVEGLGDEARRRVERFRRTYRDLLTETQGTTLVETCRMILDRTRAWQDIEALPPSARLTTRLNLHRLLDLAEGWSPLRGRPSLEAFLDYLEGMEQEPAEELDAARLSGEEAVTLVTVHRAKGLEWDTVALPAVTKGNFPSSSQQYPDPARFAEFVGPELRIDTVLDDLPQDEGSRTDFFRERHMRQEWRVAYVALTRARRRLLVSGAYWYGLPEPTKKPKEPSELFLLVEESPVSRSEGSAELRDRPPVLRPPAQHESPDPLFPDGWGSGVRMEIERPGSLDRLADERGVRPAYDRIVAETTGKLFSLAEPGEEAAPEDRPGVSVTGLVTYARCPKRFFWSDVDPLPRRHSPAAARGAEIHRRIELHQRGHVPFEEMGVELYDVVEGEGPAGGYQAYLRSRFSGHKACLVEAPFTLDLEIGLRLRGRIDAVFCQDGHWEVVDFKSGRPSGDPARLVQLQAYAIAARDADFGIPPPSELSVTFAYFGGGPEEETFTVDSAWEERARNTIDELATAITRSEFPESPGPWCGRCDFLQFCPPGRAHVSGGADRSSESVTPGS